MRPAIEFWRGRDASYGWPLNDPATGEPMDVTGLTFRARIFLPVGELVLPAYAGIGHPLIDGREIEHPAMMMLDIGAGDMELAGTLVAAGRYSMTFEVNDGSGWQVLPVYDQSIVVR